MHRPLRWGSAKHVPLLLSLLLITAVHPLFRGALLLDVFFSVVLLSMIVSVLERRWLCVAVVVLAVVSLVLRYANYGIHVNAVSTLADLSTMVICVITVGGILADVLKDEAVTWDKISGGVCAYLVLGLIWSMAFSLLNRWVPNSFSGPVGSASVGASEDEETQVGTFTYFSFVTLSTLGYGDITPATGAARTLSWLEAVTGQIYLTVLVARLVGLHIAYARHGPSN